MIGAISNLKQCRGKVRFETRSDALSVAHHAFSHSHLSTYHCSACGGFHNGRSANSDVKRPRFPAYEARCERRYGPADIREA